MKYINADKLIAEIERRRLSNRYIDTEGYENELLEIIASLQQEQPECGCSEKPNNLLSEKQEQPVVDLEKEIEQAGKDVIRQAHYHNKIFNIPQNIFDDVQLMDIFKAGVYKACELGFNARKEK